MIRWAIKSRDGKRTVYGFGLEAGNIERLMNGEPIFISGESIGLPGKDFAIHYGSTKEAMIEEFRDAGVQLPPEKDWVR